MKKSLKFLMVAVLTLGATALFAQKFGRIDYMSIIYTMPEITGIQEKLEKAEVDWRQQLTGIQEEANKKLTEFQNLPEDTAEAVRTLRQTEVLDLQRRYQDYMQLAQESLQKTETELMTPLQEKADNAIKKICKAQGIIVVFQNQSVIYIDEEQTTDITAAVKTELGIPADAVPAIPGQ